MNIEKLRDKSIPSAFHDNNQAKSTRSINLAEHAKKYLVENNIDVTEVAFLSATRKVDDEGKGISHSTLYKNEIVKEIFHTINLKTSNARKKNKKKKPSKSKRSLDGNLRELYKDSSKLDVIKSLELLKEENRILEKKNRELRVERDELERQNENQLVLLTQLQEINKDK